jgi:DNA polymerase III epsilon subunit-like protein
MNRQPYVVLDTETGGLDANRNPLLTLSISTAVGDEHDPTVPVMPEHTLGLAFRPPTGTAIEVPADHHMYADKKIRRDIVGYFDVITREPVDLSDAKWIITSYAAEVNGFVQPDAMGQWDLARLAQTELEGISYEEGTQTAAAWLKQMFPAPPVAAAYNESFDRKFISGWMPGLIPHLGHIPGKDGPVFWDVLAMVRKHYKDRGIKESASLVNACKVAGIEHGSAHTASGDVHATIKLIGWLRRGGK